MRRLLASISGLVLLAGCGSHEGGIVFTGAHYIDADQQLLANSPALNGPLDDPDSLQDELRLTMDADLGETVLEALHHGVELRIAVHARAVRPRAWLPDETLAEVVTDLLLSWHPMTEQYVLLIPDTGAQLAVSQRETAAGALRGPFTLLLPNTELGEQGEWQIHAELDLDSLPSPLRLPAWFSRDWHVSSAWYAVQRR